MALIPPRTPRSPRLDPESAPFWQAAREGRLLFRRCTRCHEPHFYPRSHCPFCFHGETAWEQAAGRGTVYSFSVARKAPVPYMPAYVQLVEGPCLLSNLVECDPDRVRVGDALELVFVASEDGQPVPMFRPARDGGV